MAVVPTAVLDAIVRYFRTKKSLNFSGNDPTPRIERHQGVFVRRRAARLGDANPAWVTDPDLIKMKARIESEFEDVRRYLAAKLGPIGSDSAFVRSADSTPHLDLRWAATMLTTTSSGAAARLTRDYVLRRRYWVSVIVWRAAAISADFPADSPPHLDVLWNPSSTGETATLNDTAMDEIVDRRLRICERMHHQVSAALVLAPGSRLTGTVPAPTGPWTDRFQIRMFEYPRIRVHNPDFAPTIPNVIGAANIAAWDAAAPVSESWQWENRYLRRLVWTEGSFRMAPPSDLHWHIDTTDPDEYQIALAPAGGVTAAQAIDLLFTPSPDWWGRSWMFCDHVVSALQIEALRLGLARRNGGSDDAFNHVLTDHAPEFIILTAFVGSRPPDKLMGGQAADEWFDNADIQEPDLQIGDQLILWNSFLYPFIATAEWRLENSVIMDIDGDPSTGSIVRQKLLLQGHGIGEKAYSQYLREIADYLAEGLADVRDVLAHHIASSPGDTEIVYPATGADIVRWDPYDAFTSQVTGAGGSITARVPGAWWVRIPIGPNTDWADVDTAIAAIPKAVKDDPSPGTGYTHPPPSTGSTVTDAVFFPLFEPAGGWDAYFALRRTDATAHVPPNLREVYADRRLAPGLFQSGVDTSDIAVVRARVRP